MKATEQYFLVVLSVRYAVQVVQSFEFMYENLNCDQLNESSSANLENLRSLKIQQFYKKPMSLIVFFLISF